MRIGFLFNHDQIHQVAHSLPAAVALMGAAEVVLATTNVRRADAKPLQLSVGARSSALLHRALESIVPAHKLLIYRDNLSFFRSLDALVVTERTSLLLKTRYGLNDLPIILTDHGAGDRAIGFGAEARRFDFILAPGAKTRDRLMGEADVDPRRIAITGYQKFDLEPSVEPWLPFAGNGRTTVLYNPHVSPHLSSWYSQGRQVLDFFLKSDRYNLIFAPHVMLFERRWALSIDKLRARRPGKLDPRYARAPNMHIDLGSVASTDMSYTNAADVYLGDVSSQIYEFLKRPRPAVFINTHRVAHEGDPNYAHWRAGPVIEDIKQLDHALDEAISRHADRDRMIQRALFDYTIDAGDQPAGVRAAAAILWFLESPTAARAA